MDHRAPAVFNSKTPEKGFFQPPNEIGRAMAAYV
jgi:hypothetical protein